MVRPPERVGFAQWRVLARAEHVAPWAVRADALAREAHPRRWSSQGMKVVASLVERGLLEVALLPGSTTVYPDSVCRITAAGMAARLDSRGRMRARIQP